MNLIRSPKGSKTLFHVSLPQDDGKVCSEIRSLQSSPNISSIIKDGVESSKLIDQTSSSQGQQLDHSSKLFDIQRPFSPSHFFSQHGNSFITRLQSEEMCDSQSLSSSNSGIPNLVGYWPVAPLQTGSRSDSHVFQQHPYLVFQQQLLSPLNTRFEHSYSPQATTHFPLSVYSSYLSQRNLDSSFGMNRQPQPADKFPSLPFSTSPLYQLHDNNLANYHSYLQFPSLHNTYPPMGSISYSSGEYSNYYINNQPVFSDLTSGNDITSQSYTQFLSRNHSFPPSKQSKSAEYLPSARSIKTGNSFSNRPFKCDQCFQSFNRNHDLKRHKRIHLAVKPFPCPSCEKSFSRKDALKRHILVKGCIG
ncbi:hypothetical protein PNEG_00487 [Pneumocystis murina B123]|uniref:C2H2-type domain-containing protein n=1 Tax=Pneumocystis murina (strain B123) TaxID=1069680 RepID=M7NVY4_PNEMU|nr:hypothetical protein PNEG_00487 [Pneumocystis murina B123]EMR11472.1 hypothetical protein PNEG_00487 [Pneumocystis murina B123]